MFVKSVFRAWRQVFAGGHKSRLIPGSTDFLMQKRCDCPIQVSYAPFSLCTCHCCRHPCPHTLSVTPPNPFNPLCRVHCSVSHTYIGAGYITSPRFGDHWSMYGKSWTCHLDVGMHLMGRLSINRLAGALWSVRR